MRQLKINVSPTIRTDESLSKYLVEISRIATITPNEEEELVRKIRKGDQTAKEQLVKANLRFVVSVAKQYQHQGLPLIDLINEGNIGLIKATERFDETRGFKFISYAVWWIRQSIMQALTEQCRVVRIPVNQSMLLNKINKYKEKFEQDNERKPTISEMANEMNMEENKIRQLLVASHQHLSIDAPIDDNITYADTMQAEAEHDLSSLNTDLNTILSHVLSRREMIIVQKVFGIGCPSQTYEEIALELGLSRERVRQIKEKSLDKIRKSDGLTLIKKYVA